MDSGDAAARESETSAAVTSAVPVMRRCLARHGVNDVRWFLAFYGYPVVWLVTSTDADKATVVEKGFFRPDVRSALAGAGVAPDLVDRAAVTVESQETVDRDFEGSWFYAMR